MGPEGSFLVLRDPDPAPLGQWSTKAVTYSRPAVSMARGKEALETEAELSRGRGQLPPYAVFKD